LIISSLQIQMVLRLYGGQKLQAAGEQKTGETDKSDVQQGDRADFSAEAVDHKKLREVVLNAPEVREELVQKIKTALEKGEYQVSAEDVADKILGRLLMDRLL